MRRIYAARCCKNLQDATMSHKMLCASLEQFAAACSILLLPPPHKIFVRQQRVFPQNERRRQICSTIWLQSACSNLGLLQLCCKMQKSAEAVLCGFCVDVKVQEPHSIARMFELRGSNLQTKWTKKRGLLGSRFLKLVHMGTRPVNPYSSRDTS